MVATANEKYKNIKYTIYNNKKETTKKRNNEINKKINK